MEHESGGLSCRSITSTMFPRMLISHSDRRGGSSLHLDIVHSQGKPFPSAIFQHKSRIYTRRAWRKMRFEAAGGPSPSSVTRTRPSVINSGVCGEVVELTLECLLGPFDELAICPGEFTNPFEGQSHRVTRAYVSSLSAVVNGKYDTRSLCVN